MKLFVLDSNTWKHLSVCKQINSIELNTNVEWTRFPNLSHKIILGSNT